MSLNVVADWRVLRRFFKYLKPYTKQLTVFVLVIAIGSLAPIFIPYFLKVIVDEVLPAKDFEMLIHILLLWSGVILVQAGTAFAVDYLREFLSSKIAMDIRTDIFSHLLELPVTYFKDNNFGEILHKLDGEVNEIEGVFTSELFRLLQSAILLSGILVMITLLSAKLLLLIVISVPLFILTFSYFKPRYERQTENIHKTVSDVLHFFTDRLKKVSLIKVFHGYTAERLTLKQKINAQIDSRLARARTSSTFTFLSTFLVASASMLILFIGGREVLAGAMTIGTLIAAYQYLVRFFFPLADLVESQMDFVRVNVSMRRILEILDTPVENQNTQVPSWNGPGTVAFQNVTFCYKQNTILNNISLELETGKKYALVGHSGAGKTTMLELIFRFNNPDTGCITYNGSDIATFDLEAWRQSVAFVTQEKHLLDESIRYNILYGTNSPNHVSNQSPNGLTFDTAHLILSTSLMEDLDKNSQKVSGGEAQRIALARAVMKNADIILLDEATSAIDSISEKQVLSYLGDVWKNKTVITVSHRMSTLKFMDEVVCLDKGAIVERGTYEQLALNNGLGWRLIGDQLMETPRDEESNVHKLDTE